MGIGVGASGPNTAARMLRDDCSCTVRLVVLLTATLPVLEPVRLVLGSTAKTEKLPARTLLNVRVPSACVVPVWCPPKIVLLARLTVAPLTGGLAPSLIVIITLPTPFKVRLTLTT